MNLETGLTPAPESLSDEHRSRRSGADRRTDSDRRRNRGLFEVRARKDGLAYDRRRRERRDRNRSWLGFWRRDV